MTLQLYTDYQTVLSVFFKLLGFVYEILRTTMFNYIELKVYLK